MAVHGLDLLLQARLYPDLASALADCRRVVACSGRGEGPPLPLQDPGTALAWLLAPGAGPGVEAPAALVFGREDRGLSNDELLQAGRLLTIDTGASYGSLNLAQAAAIVLHRWRELEQASGCAAQGASGTAVSSGTEQPIGADPADPVEHDAIRDQASLADPCERGPLEAMLSDAEALLLEVGFLYPHTARARMARVRQLLQRGQVNQEEVALLRGMVRQLRWASRQGGASTPQTP